MRPVDDLHRLAVALPQPASYFAGKGGPPWCWPTNLIAFARRTRRDLQRRTFESRLHTRYVLVVNLATPGTLNLDSTPYRLLPGQCHLIFPHQLHTYHDVEREDLLWLFLTFELPEETPLRSLRQTTLPLNTETRRLLVAFLTGYESGKSSPHRLQSLLSDFLLHLVEAAGRAGPKHRSGGRGDKLLTAIHRHHARALPGSLTVRQLVPLLSMSESRLRTRFREEFGVSLGRYLHHLRLQEAAAMMKHSQASLTEIALSCGFGSSSAFSRAFRKWTGAPPRRFRQSLG